MAVLYLLFNALCLETANIRSGMWFKLIPFLLAAGLVCVLLAINGILA
jgi:hypothetical protein